MGGRMAARGVEGQGQVSRVRGRSGAGVVSAAGTRGGRAAHSEIRA